MTIHTPYDGSQKPFTISLKPLDPNEWIEVDDNLAPYLTEKRRLYAEETHNVIVSEPGSETAQQEVLDMLVEHLLQRHPDVYRRTENVMEITPPNCRHPGEGRGPASDYATALAVKLDPGLRRDDGTWDSRSDITQTPLARAALLVQEDFLLMRKSPEGWRLVAGSLSFPSAWILREKFGKPLHAIHGPVPGFNEGTRNASLLERMFDNLWPERPVMRWNWSLYGEAKLYYPAVNNQIKNRFGPGNIADNVTLRLERQTLRKLAKSGDVIFTVRIHLNPLEVLETHADGPALARAIADQVNAMTPDELHYKGLTAEKERLLNRLDKITERKL